MAYFKETFMLNDEEKKQVSEMSGKIILWILEGRSVGYMSAMLHLSPQQIESNINENAVHTQEACWKKTIFQDTTCKVKNLGHLKHDVLFFLLDED